MVGIGIVIDCMAGVIHAEKEWLVGNVKHRGIISQYARCGTVVWPTQNVKNHFAGGG